MKDWLLVGRMCLWLFFIAINSTTWSQTTIYSRANSTWDNVDAVNGSWSTVGIGGAACSCAPSATDSVVIIGNSITLSSNGDVKSLTIGAGGTLTVNNGIGLDINNSGVVTIGSGGLFTHSGSGSSAHLDFETGTNELVVESTGSFHIEDVYIAANETLVMSGAGNINLTDDFIFIGSNSMVTSNLTGNLNLTGTDASSLWFQPGSRNCTFVNNSYMTYGRYLYFESDSNTVINNDTMDLVRSTRGIFLVGASANGTVIENNGTMMVAGAFQANSSTVTFNNRGTLDIDGDFIGFNGPGSLYNLEKATFKWSGTNDNNSLRLYCNYDSSTVIYDGTTDQRDLFEPQDNYVHIVFENTGVKRYHNNFTVKGNMIINSELEIESGFRYLYLDSAATITINHNGSMVHNGGSGRIEFLSDNDYTLTIHDTLNGFQWQRLEIDTNVNVTLNGDGIAAFDGFSTMSFKGDGSSVTNNLTDTMSLSGISFLSTSDTSVFTNNGHIVNTGDLYYGGTQNTFNNNGSYVLGDDLTFDSTGNSFNGSPTSSMVVPDNLSFNDSLNSLTSGGTFTLGDQLIFNAPSCSLIVNGDMTAANFLRVVSSTFDDNVIVINSGASLSVASYMQLTDADFVLKNSGTFSLSGQFDDFNGEDSIFNLAGSTFNYAGVHNANVNTEIGLYCDYAGSTFNYNRGDGTKQEVITPKDAYHHLTVSGSGIKEPLNNLTINGNMTISGTASFDVEANDVDLIIGEGWSNSGTYVVDTQSVLFTGPTAGNISGTSNTSFYRVTVDKSSDEPALSMSAKMSIEKHIELTDGVILSSTGGELIILDDATTSNGNDTSYVYGPVQKVGNDPFVFPLGHRGNWARLELFDLINSPAVTDTFTASFSRGRHTESFWDSLDYVGDPGGLKNVSIVEYWELERTSGNTQPKVTLYWENGDSSYISDLTDLTIAHYLGGAAWSYEPATTSGTIAKGSISTNSNLDSFSPFTFGSFTKSVNPLPIGLLSFDAQLIDNQVSLDWITSSEINNDYFVLEKTIDGIHFDPIGRVKGAGNSTDIRHYAFIDPQPSNGYSYYRLIQVDFDGATSSSELVAIYYEANLNLVLYPNPASNYVRIHVNKEMSNEPLHIMIRDIKGKIIRSWYRDVENDLLLDVSDLNAGFYNVEVQSGVLRDMRKLVIIND